MLTTDTQQMQQYQDRMNPWLQATSTGLQGQPSTGGGEIASSQMYPQGNPNQGGGISALGTAMGVGLGGLGGNRNLSDLLNRRGFAGGQHPLRTYQNPFTQLPQYPSRPKQPSFDVAGGFEEFGETLGGYKETLGGYGEQLGGFGETLGGYGEQISGFEEQLGGFGEQFSGIEEQVGGVGEDINEINERLGGIEEGISTLKISKPEQKQNPYSNMFNPFSFIGNWGGSRSRMSYR